MIALVEGAERRKTPNEIALNILLAGLTITFLVATATLKPFAIYAGTRCADDVLIALLVALIPTTIGAPALGDRHRRHGPARAPQRAGDVGPRSRGLRRRRRAAARQDRHDHARQPPGRGVHRRSTASTSASSPRSRSSPRSPTRRRRGARSSSWPRGYGVRERELRRARGALRPVHGHDAHERRRRRRARRSARARATRSRRFIAANGGSVACRARRRRRSASRAQGGTPLVVARDNFALGVVHLKDIVKGGMHERFDELRRMGIRTVMITGDNPVTAAVIAEEAGVDDFLAEATPEAKMALIKDEQAQGPAGRDDRRRHERRARARAGRRRRGDEHRHVGRQGGRQHGRPRLEPDEADRDRRGRQAAADDARRADDVLDRERRRQVLRHHPGDVRGDLRRRRRLAGRSTTSTSWSSARPRARSSRRSSSTR